ncbi:dnaJ homolog subfamily C member 17-like [Babylonia areolata]|uniref:dnaJ homolog subfamily C member 17-like n=1 Tax=Babylonia areolata TaxID=304850 RepID=UPI003FD5B4EC
MAKSKEDIMKMDLYGILGVSSKASEKEIVKAYRKKALKCHPDKNPDNPKAAELFHELSKALEVLTDPSAKAAYDNVLKAKQLAEERNRELDSKRRKLKDDLEARERLAEHRRDDDTRAKQNLLAEIKRLRKEGSKLLEQEQQLMREKMKNATTVGDDSDSDTTVATPKIKVRWNAKRADTVGAYDEDDLSALFGRYGQIANIIVSSKKKGSAIIEFESYTPTLKLAENERGTNSNPLTVKWLSGKPSVASANSADKQTSSSTSASATPMFTSSSTASSFPDTGFSTTTTTINDRDFESLVLMKMRQAEERKRLIEQMQKEDEEEEK